MKDRVLALLLGIALVLCCDTGVLVAPSLSPAGVTAMPAGAEIAIDIAPDEEEHLSRAKQRELTVFSVLATGPQPADDASLLASSGNATTPKTTYEPNVQTSSSQAVPQVSPVALPEKASQEAPAGGAISQSEGL